MAKIIEIKNGIAKVEWRKNSEHAYAEVSASAAVGDVVAERVLVFNGGDSRYEEMEAQFEA